MAVTVGGGVVVLLAYLSKKKTLFRWLRDTILFLGGREIKSRLGDNFRCLLLFVCLFAKEPLSQRGCGRGPLYEVPVSHSSSKVGIHPSL